jgi:hypothetical protein
LPPTLVGGHLALICLVSRLQPDFIVTIQLSWLKQLLSPAEAGLAVNNSSPIHQLKLVAKTNAETLNDTEQCSF